MFKDLPKLYKNIVGFLPQTVIDYPNHISSIIFLGGCNFRCEYCYNKTCVNFKPRDDAYEYFQSIIEYLDRSVGKFIDGITITGGEPTIYGANLIDFVKFIKDRYPDIDIKLDTNGSNLPFLNVSYIYFDYIAIDIKSYDETLYKNVLNANISISDIIKVIHLSKHKFDGEYRITLYPPAIPDLNKLKEFIIEYFPKEKTIYFQQFVNEYDMIGSPKANEVKPYNHFDIIKIKNELKDIGFNVYFRSYE